jgi:hypothetical protein
MAIKMTFVKDTEKRRATRRNKTNGNPAGVGAQDGEHKRTRGVESGRQAAKQAEAAATARSREQTVPAPRARPVNCSESHAGLAGACVTT